MPRRTDLSSVLVIGSGPIVIGQAAEFDYSGTQACRVLRAEGLRVILVNSNPATIMTDPEFADATYIEPITPEVVEQIIATERPDAILPTLGGQTALNTAIALDEAGVLERYGVQMIGVNTHSIHLAEDRQAFKDVVERCGAESARSVITHTMDEVLAAAEELGYPLVVRPSFTMGGLGSGIAYDEADLRRIAGAGLHYSPTTEVLLEESILGWKEYELELMRDHADNVVVVCSIENVDPVGVHTGDSVTVAPALTLTDREYQRLRDIGIAVIREVGVDTGGCNIQFAVEPDTGRVVVIEMNPRVSRSSALASKATGFPIAKIAARLAVGYTLDEIPNDITGSTPASFEPALDYIVVKVPRFAFEKFPGADPTLTTTMKSVGEAMALGRSFTEALGKAMRSIDKGGSVFHWDGPVPSGEALAELLEAIRVPTEHRLIQVQQVLRSVGREGGASVADVYEATGIDPWFLDQVLLVNQIADQVATAAGLDRELLRRAKRHGLSDAQIAGLRGMGEETVRQLRHALGPASGLQDRGHLRRGVRRPHAVPLLGLRRRDRGRAARAAGGPHPRVRAQPDRAGHRVRLLVRARRPGAAGPLRDRHGELQPGDGLHGLRHLRPAVLRAVDLRGRPGGVRRGAGRRAGGGRHRAAGRSDAAVAGRPARGRRRADPRHPARGDRRGRGPRRVRGGARRRGAACAGVRHRAHAGGGDRDRGPDRVPGPRAAVVRARRTRHGDRLLRRPARPVRAACAGRRRARRAGRRDPAAAHRPVPGRRDRAGRRRAVRRRRDVPRRRDGAHRGGGDPLR